MRCGSHCSVCSVTILMLLLLLLIISILFMAFVVSSFALFKTIIPAGLMQSYSCYIVYVVGSTKMLNLLGM